MRAAPVTPVLGTDPEVVPLQDWPIYVDDLPDEPDNLVRVHDTEGRVWGRVHHGQTITYPGLQFWIRGVDHTTGYPKAAQIEAWLDKVSRQEVTVVHPVGTDPVTYLIQAIHRTTGLGPVQTPNDEKDRSSFVINAIIKISVKE